MLNFNMRTFCGEFGLKDAGKEVNVMGRANPRIIQEIITRKLT